MRRSTRSLVTTASATALLAGAIIWAAYPRTTAALDDVGADGVREVKVHVYAWGLHPSVVRVEPGQRVRFVVVTDDVMHGFAVNELGVNLVLAPGRTSRSTDVDVGSAATTFPIHCSVFCGLGHGAMKGRLVVGAPPPDRGRAAPWIATGLAVVFAGAVLGVAARRKRAP